MNQKKSSEDNNIIIETDIADNLNAKDIYNDIKKLKWLIQKTEYKIKRYEENLQAHLLHSKKHKDIEKGLSLYNLLSKHRTRI